MKLLFSPVLLLLFSIPMAGQSPNVEQAVAPGCGKDNTKFDVRTTQSNHPFQKPEAGKALVYFLEDDADFASRPRPSTRFGLDGAWIGATNRNSYFYVSVDPGEHHLCADWQSFLGFTTGHKSGAASLTAAEGSSYFFLVKNRSNHDNFPASMKFATLNPDEAQLLMSKFALSTSRPKK